MGNAGFDPAFHNAILAGINSVMVEPGSSISLEIGKDADIAIFTGNPMEVFTEIVYTIVNGEIVYERKCN